MQQPQTAAAPDPVPFEVLAGRHSAQFSPARPFTDEEHATWREILDLHRDRRQSQILSIFSDGLTRLDMDRPRIPTLAEVNAKLQPLTGWRGVYVKGLEDGRAFYPLLRDRLFPVGNFVRDRKDLAYTPAPDIVHDLYGHIPFHADRAYADYFQRYGEFACRFLDDPARLSKLERYYWFTAEFGLVKTKQGRRIFGAGIASSVGECAYALSAEPEVRPFDVEALCAQDYRVDHMQRVLFELESPEQLYQAFPKLMACVQA